MKKAPHKSKGYLALFATILVVAGVVAVAYVAAPQNPPKPAPALIPESPTSTPAGPALLIVDSVGARIVTDGKERPAKWPDDTAILGVPLSNLEGRDVLTGEPAYLLPEFVRATSSAGLRSPDGRRSLYPAPARKDGAGSIEYRYGTESRTYVLRLPNGKAVSNVVPIGWWDSDTMAATGYVTTSRILFAITLTGETYQVAMLPDTIDAVRADNGSVWYVEVQPGEGLESAPSPPSSLHRVSRDGKDAIVVGEPDRIILTYIDTLISPDAFRVAYQTDDSHAVAIGQNGDRIPMGLGMPLAFLDDGRLLLQRGESLIVKDPSTGKEAQVANAPGDDGAVFLLPPQKVDGTAETK